MRPQTDMQSLGGLNPAFQQMGEVMPGFDKVALMKSPHLERISHVHHAGNSSGIVDGAAAVVMTTAARAQADGLEVLSVLRGWSYVGVDPTEMGIGPVPAIRACLERARAQKDSGV